MNISDQQISAVIRRLMDERHIGVNELGRRLGKSSGRISEKLSNRSTWKFEELFSIADALGVSPSYIVDELMSVRRGN